MSERSHSRTPPPDRRPARGIRGGKAARRKREAYEKYEAERLGIPIEQVPVVHQGGQSRPLHTSPYWIPDESDPEVVSSERLLVTSNDRGSTGHGLNHLLGLMVHYCFLITFDPSNIFGLDPFFPTFARVFDTLGSKKHAHRFGMILIVDGIVQLFS